MIQENKPGEAWRGRERRKEATRRQERPEEARRGQKRPGEAKRGQERPEEARRGQERPGEGFTIGFFTKPSKFGAQFRRGLLANGLGFRVLLFLSPF